jgi:hypothetical protein
MADNLTQARSVIVVKLLDRISLAIRGFENLAVGRTYSSAAALVLVTALTIVCDKRFSVDCR